MQIFDVFFVFEQAVFVVKQTVELLVIWGAITLMWYHCNQWMEWIFMDDYCNILPDDSDLIKFDKLIYIPLRD